MSLRYLYLKNADGIIQQQQFRNPAYRKKIIEKWEKLYGKKFYELTVEEEPEVKKPKQAKTSHGKYVNASKPVSSRIMLKNYYKSLDKQRG